MKLGVVAHDCNPSYSGGGDQRTAVQGQYAKKFLRPHLNQWLGAETCACHPSYAGG
jgi:hypothetical protein